MTCRVVSVSRDGAHRFSKLPVEAIRLEEGLGVEGDAHAGTTVQHRSRITVDPAQPNLRQVHLIAVELLEELAEQGFAVEPGQLGENVTTRGLDLIGLPRGTRLRLGAEAVVELTGLRNPCGQIEDFRPGLLKAVVARTPDGNLIRKAGVMAVVKIGGRVRPYDAIAVTLPPMPHVPLKRV
jgi:MOSC domain-containing protein YiiM